MSTAGRRSARGSSSIRARGATLAAAALWLALAPAAAAAAERDPLRAAERELAEAFGLYVVVAPAAEKPLPEPPAEYRVGFEDGWELWVGPALPRRGPLARIAAAVADGWRALRGAGPEPPPGAIALAADPATARRIHHLFRAGTPVLVAAPANPP